MTAHISCGCGFELNISHESVTECLNRANAFSVCWNCGRLLKFQHDPGANEIRTRPATPGEVKAIMTDAVIWCVLDELQKLIVQRGRFIRIN